MRVVAELGYEEPTPIQREAIPALLAGKDLLGQAATGTGKTAAFALPMLHKLGATPTKGQRTVRALVLVPTRELAMQVADALHKYGKSLGIRAVPIYGGQPIDRQMRALYDGVDVVIATPGRALDHLKRRSLSLKTIETVVIDEADEMLDMGFAEDLEAILAETPAETRQTALFSATFAPRLMQIAQRHLREPLDLRMSREQKRGELPKVRQQAYVVARPYKVATVVRVLDVERPGLAIVFCRTREGVETLHDALAARGFTVDQLHGGMSQEQRDRAMRRFRAEQVELLVATDVAARGLDVKGISHVVNFDVPPEPEDYIHRIGRTGRAGREGVAITLIEPREHRLLRNIERAMNLRIEMASIPTIADMRARKLELTTSAIREVLVASREAEPLDQFRVVIDALSGEHDMVEIAMAAVKLAHGVQDGDERGEDEREIPRAYLPQAGVPTPRDSRGFNDSRGGGRFADSRDSRGPNRNIAAPASAPRGFGNTRSFGAPQPSQRPPNAFRSDGPRDARPPRPDHDVRDDRPARDAEVRAGTATPEVRAGTSTTPPPPAARPGKTPSGPPTPADLAALDADADAKPAKSPKGPKGPLGKTAKPPKAAPKAGQRPDLGETARMFVGAGRAAGVRPKDIVGAIANETGLEGRAIGAIEITDGYSLVELPANRIDDIVSQLGGLKIFNKAVPVRRE